MSSYVDCNDFDNKFDLSDDEKIQLLLAFPAMKTLLATYKPSEGDTMQYMHYNNEHYKAGPRFPGRGGLERWDKSFREKTGQMSTAGVSGCP